MSLRSAVAARFKNFPLVGPGLGVADRLARDPGGAFALWRDYLETRRSASFLRSPGVERDAPVLLVLSVDDTSVYKLKLEAMLALAMTLHGWRPVVVLGSRANVLGAAYFRAFGISEFVYLEDVRLSEDDRKACEEGVRHFARQRCSLQGVKEWTFRSSWVGPQLIATLSRRLFEGRPDFDDPAMRAELLALLPYALDRVLRAEKLIERTRPAMALVNEANYISFGPLVDAANARGISVIQMIQPWRDDALVFKRLTRETRREHPASLSRETFEMIEREPWTDNEEQQLAQVFSDRYSGKWFLQARNQRNTVPLEKAEIVAQLGIDPHRKTAVVFSHVLWDGNLFYGDDLFEDYGDWFIQTLKAAAANDKLNWIVKLHPANVWKRTYERVGKEYAEIQLIRKELGQLPPHVTLLPADTRLSTYSLYRATDYGVTVRGTPGMELPCFGVPVLTAGTGRYSGLGFTIDPQSRREYLDRVGRLQDEPPISVEQIRRAKRHAHAVFLRRAWQFNTFESTFDYNAGGRRALDHNLTLQVRSLDEMKRRPDLRRFAEWANGSSVDYLERLDER